MEIVIPILAAAVAAGIVVIVMRSATARQLAEARAAGARPGQLADAPRDKHFDISTGAPMCSGVYL